ncbi:hypothetical protein A2634_03430 [Candidatus Amesbacteria bacterium RIFCSPHIGHO2_01_FULL_48_32]|uniref:Purine nucleoside phosphorylase n=1 Tax=Candidatus Amesbacteria bacterium RIFCSPLOWO2_01_FULL_48_25 TaxID=1797259 RepID=A0A1F4ZDM2_9BACT|nr:MAG: hypothetical protein A2634_03430 [Candidatus Amesbacteria bacterium RIFCSPHIGHO2_01_FULL_48_32]OGD04308.1 MAG: hypothetical protein A2989_04695 [Candidatus Amesbacteria bacterium RIFCSPLOWO2_01_FULL_48_25]HJZ05509.1 laccase domain-containing protein [Patescibacteria group bacterium]
MNLIYGASTVKDGNMSFRWGEEGIVNSNRKRFLGRLGLKIEDCVFTSLNHGADIMEVGSKDKGRTVECDAIVTDEPGVVLFMLTADCFPVVVCDEEKVALVHLGYQGVWKKLIQKVARKFGKDARVVIGPGVRKESYVFETVEQANDPEWKPFLEKVPGGVSVDLVGYIKKQVNNLKVEDCGIDTAKDLNYFSHYRSVRIGEPEGRFATIAALYWSYSSR